MQLQNNNKASIKNWNEADRPREKFAAKGRESLSNAELLAILLGSGNNEQNAVQLSQEILKKHKDNLIELSEASLTDLQKFKGIGEAKAITIAAALELGRRRQAETKLQRPQINSSRNAFDILNKNLGDLAQEHFWILILNQKNEVLDEFRISQGGLTATVVDAKIIFRQVLTYSRATGIILAHNHPSGNLQPSQADINLTKKIKEAGRVLDINVLDHIIIGANDYYSFLDEDMM